MVTIQVSCQSVSDFYHTEGSEESVDHTMKAISQTPPPISIRSIVMLLGSANTLVRFI